MNVVDAIKTRRSIRSYMDKPVEDQKLKEVLEAGRLALSASNRQEWRYIVVKDKNTREKLCETAGNQSSVAEAPIVIVCCAETNQHVMRCGEKCYPIDLAISIDHITLRAWELGLGTCWIGAFNAEPVKKLLNIPDNIVVVELLTLGYPKSVPSATPRKLIDEIIHYEKW